MLFANLTTLHYLLLLASWRCTEPFELIIAFVGSNACGCVLLKINRSPASIGTFTISNLQTEFEEFLFLALSS
jgi:hypothetical protein